MEINWNYQVDADMESDSFFFQIHTQVKTDRPPTMNMYMQIGGPPDVEMHVERKQPLVALRVGTGERDKVRLASRDGSGYEDLQRCWWNEI